MSRRQMNDLSDLADAPASSRGRFLGWSAVRFPRTMGTPPFALRLLRLRDLPELHLLFGTWTFGRAASRGIRRVGSLLSFWRWLRRSFDLVYLAECTETGSPRTVGFVGLYDLVPGGSASVSAAVFDPADRRRGYGRRSLDILCTWLSGKFIARAVFAEVLKGNSDSIDFLRAAQFEVCGEEGKRFLLRRRL